MPTSLVSGSGYKTSLTTASNRACFFSAAKEIQEHLQVCTSLVTLLEDISSVEKMTGTQLIRIGANSHGSGSSNGSSSTISLTSAMQESLGISTSAPKDEALLASLVLSWEAVIAASATTRGKLGINLATSVVQSICKPVPEQSKGIAKRLQALLSKVQPLTEKLTRAKLDAQRQLEMYQKLCQDTGAAIRAREGPSRETGDAAAPTSSSSSSSPSSAPSPSSSASSASTASSAPSSSSSSSSDKQGDFVNRAMNKLISKINPSSAQVTDRRIHEMVREIDAAERLLDNKCGKINKLQTQVEGVVVRALGELDECEGARLGLMKEALLRLHLAHDFSARESTDAAQALLAQIEAAGGSDDDIARLVAEIDGPVGMPSSLGERAGNYEIDDLVARMHKAAEALDYFRALTNKALESLADIADAERGYSKSLLWTLDKHGYSKADRGSGLRALARQISQLGQASCAVLISSIESPSIRKGWEATAKALINMAELAGRSAEDAEATSAKLDAMQRRLEGLRRDVQDRVAQNVRKIDIASQGAIKAAQRCQKAQREIKEKKVAVRRAREDILPASSSSRAASISPGPADRSQTPSPDQDLRGRGSTGLDSLMENLGSTLRTHTEKLGVVVGLESENDRLVRNEKQIVALEAEERGLADGARRADVVVASANDAARAELSALLSSAKECLCADFDAMKGLLKSLAQGKAQHVALTREMVVSIRNAYEHVDLEQDMHYFVSMASSSVETQDGEEAEMLNLCFSPEFRLFSPEVVKCIEDERRVLDIAPFVHRPYVASSLLPSFSSPSSSARKEVPSSAGGEEEAEGRGSNGRGSCSTTGATGGVREASPPLQTARSGEAQSTPPSGGDDGLSKPPRRRSRSAGSIDETLALAADKAGAPGAGPGPRLGSGAGLGAIHERNDGNALDLSGSAGSPGDVRDASGLDYAKFGLSANDKVLGSFSCAYYPKKGLLTHGRMYILQHYVAYSGWPDTHILIPMQAVAAVDKMNTLQIFPNAIQITSKSGECYFFGTFVERERCFGLINSLVSVTRELAGLNLPAAALVDPSDREVLVPGGHTTVDRIRHQFDDVSSKGNGAARRTASQREEGAEEGGEAPGEGGAGGIGSSNSSAALATPPPSPSLSSLFPAVPEATRRTASILTTPSTGITTELLSRLPPAPASASAPAPAADSGSPASLALAAAGAAAEALGKPLRPSLGADAAQESPSAASAAPFVPVDDKVRLTDLFGRSNVFLLHSQTLDGACRDLWAACWLQGRGYADFLDSQGDLLIAPGEWAPLAGRCVEDVTALPFTHVRPFSYSHPRTTMLMFGPKNAPATQLQYLYLHSTLPPLPQAGDGPVDALASARPTRGCVLTVTQFDGIPMADVFKVMHYWTFEAADDGEGSRTVLRIGVAVHFIKSSMLKSQISSGVRDELGVLSRQWCTFAEQRVAHAAKRRSLGELAGALSAVRNSRRFSLKELADAGLVSEIAPENEKAAAAAAAPALVLAPPPAPPGPSEGVVLCVAGLLLLLLVVQIVYNRRLVGQLGETAAAVQALAKALQEQSAAQARIVRALQDLKK